MVLFSRKATGIDLSRLHAGLKGTTEVTVGEEHTAPQVGSGRIHVLATPVMINLIEAAALAAVEHLLPAGHQSLGTHLDVRHIAATPVGMKAYASAELIGDGVHERVVVNVERFDLRVQRKVRPK